MKDDKEVLDTFIRYVENIESFARENIPDYITQLLNYASWDHYLAGAVFLIFTVFFFVCALFCVWVWIKNKDDSFGDSFEYFMTFWFCFVLLIGCLYGFFENYRSLKKIEMAPKVYILDYLRNKK